MKKISFAVVCTVVLSSLVGSAVAQTVARAPIPFSFSVHDKTFPAGTYEVRYLGSSMVRLAKPNGGEGVTIFAPSAIRESSNMHLLFRQYGERFFLSAMTDPALHYEAELPVSSSERRARKSHGVPTIVALQARK